MRLAIFGSVLRDPAHANDIDVAWDDAARSTPSLHAILILDQWRATHGCARVRTLDFDLHKSERVPSPYGLHNDFLPMLGEWNVQDIRGLSAAFRAFGRDASVLLPLLRSNGTWEINADSTTDEIVSRGYAGNGPVALRNALKRVTADTLAALQTLPIYHVIERVIDGSLLGDPTICWEGCPAGTRQIWCTWDGKISTTHQRNCWRVKGL